MSAVVVPALSTARLNLAPLALADAPAIQARFPRWEIVRYLSSKVPWPYPDDGALTFVRDLALPAMDAGREWHWSLRPKASPGDLIGVISLMDVEGDNRGFWLDPDWWGRGLMTEASEAVTGFWFEVLDRLVLRATKAASNIASSRITERSGMRLLRVETRDYVCGRRPGEVWEITAEEWRARPAR